MYKSVYYKMWFPQFDTLKSMFLRVCFVLHSKGQASLLWCTCIRRQKLLSKFCPSDSGTDSSSPHPTPAPSFISNMPHTKTPHKNHIYALNNENRHCIPPLHINTHSNLSISHTHTHMHSCTHRTLKSLDVTYTHTLRCTHTHTHIHTHAQHSHTDRYIHTHTVTYTQMHIHT